MVDSASCAVSALTEGLWSASLPLNSLKQPYTKPKSSFIPRKGALFPATALVKRWQSHHRDVCFLYVLAHARFWIYHWTCILHSRYASVLVSGARHNSQTSESSRDMDLHRPSNITEITLQKDIPSAAAEEVFPMASFQYCLTEGSQRGTQTPSPTQQTACIQGEIPCLHLATTLSPVWATALHQLSLHLHSG